MTLGKATAPITILGAAFLAALALAACGNEAARAANQQAGDMTAPPDNPGGPGGPGGPSGTPTPPEGAIPVGDDVYMVPIGTDKEGCETFTAWSATKPVAFVIYYRSKSGGFTADRNQADCKKK